MCRYRDTVYGAGVRPLTSYAILAKGIERFLRILFRRKWAFEWTTLIAETGAECSEHPLLCWLDGRTATSVMVRQIWC